MKDWLEWQRKKDKAEVNRAIKNFWELVDFDQDWMRQRKARRLSIQMILREVGKNASGHIP